MKAEHRKELETNILADRMGRAIQSMKQRPDKRLIFWGLLVLAVLVIGWFFFRKSQLTRDESSRDWRQFALNEFEPRGLKSENNTSKAVLFQNAWIYLWDYGINKIGTKPNESLALLDRLENTYEELSRMAKDDPIYLPEALYALAVIEETRAIRNRDKLNSALERFKTVADKHKDTAFGKMAQDRIEILENKDKRDEVALFYQKLQEKYRVPERPPEKLFK